MEGLDIICAQNWVEQFRYNLAHHEQGLSFLSYSIASLDRNRLVITASDFVYRGFDWSETTQHPDGSYCGPWRNRRNSLVARKLLTR